MRENMSTRKCHIGLDARKFSSEKICTFRVYHCDCGREVLGGEPHQNIPDKYDDKKNNCYESDTKCLKPIFHCNVNPFALGSRVGLHPQREHFVLGIPTCRYLKNLVDPTRGLA